MKPRGVQSWFFFPFPQAVSQGSSDSQILDLSNRFYTLIPHDFGMKKPPLLSNADSVQVIQRDLRGCGRGAWVCSHCPSSLTLLHSPGKGAILRGCF